MVDSDQVHIENLDAPDIVDAGSAFSVFLNIWIDIGQFYPTDPDYCFNAKFLKDGATITVEHDWEPMASGSRDLCWPVKQASKTEEFSHVAPKLSGTYQYTATVRSQSSGNVLDQRATTVEVNPTGTPASVAVQGPNTAEVGEQVEFTAEWTLPDGVQRANINWDIAGSTYLGTTASHTFTSSGQKSVFVALETLSGQELTDEEFIDIVEPADPCEGVSCPPGEICHQGSCIEDDSDDGGFWENLPDLDLPDVVVDFPNLVLPWEFNTPLAN